MNVDELVQILTAQEHLRDLPKYKNIRILLDWMLDEIEASAEKEVADGKKEDEAKANEEAAAKAKADAAAKAKAIPSKEPEVERRV